MVLKRQPCREVGAQSHGSMAMTQIASLPMDNKREGKNNPNLM
jgi:hypothetical protein